VLGAFPPYVQRIAVRFKVMRSPHSLQAGCPVDALVVASARACADHAEIVELTRGKPVLVDLSIPVATVALVYH
jgi:hypothetical protein